MSTEIQVVYRENLQPFDRIEINSEHRLEFDNGELEAAWPAEASTTEYQAAIFPIEDGGTELPEGAVILSATDTLVALVPTSEYEVN